MINLCHTDTRLTVAKDEAKNVSVNFIHCQKPSSYKTEGRKKCLEIYISFFLPSHSDDHFLKIGKINVKHACFSACFSMQNS